MDGRARGNGLPSEGPSTSSGRTALDMFTASQPSTFGSRGANAAAAFAILVAVTIVYWPGVHGFWGRDDFFQLAFVRLLDTPWSLFIHDHFPVPGSVFRPLGVASMWLGAALFGTDYQAHATADLVLHAGVGLALFDLLLRAGIPRVLALLCALLFALHPAVIGTALWWSARFDLLATLFVLLAVHAALDYRERRRATGLAWTCAAVLAAMLSKEIGLAALLPISVLWLHWARLEPGHRPRALRAIASVWLCAAIYFGWRWHVLATPASGLTGTATVTAVIAKGLLDWLRQMPGYLLFWLRLGSLQRIALVFALISMLVAVSAAALRRHAPLDAYRHVDLALCGVCLFALPALLQAPITALNGMPLRVDVSAIEIAMQSRLYYLGIAGLVIALAAILTPVWFVAAPRLRACLLAPLALAVIVFAGVSHQNASAFAQRSVEISAVARAAVAAVGQLDLPASRCQVVFLGVEPAPEWSLYVSMDSVVKALNPDLDRVKHCYFHSDYATYFYLLGAPVDAADAAPYLPLLVDGKAVPSRRIGDAVIDYLRPPESVDANELAPVRFLRYRDGRFDDVSAEVVAGRLPVILR